MFSFLIRCTHMLVISISVHSSCPTLSLCSFPLFQQFKHYVNKKGLNLAKCSAWEIDPEGGWLQFPATLAT